MLTPVQPRFGPLGLDEAGQGLWPRALLSERPLRGPEFMAQPSVDRSAEHRVAMRDIQPGKPNQNPLANAAIGATGPRC